MLCSEVLLGSKGHVEKSLLSGLGASQLYGSRGRTGGFGLSKPKQLGVTGKIEEHMQMS